MSKDWPKFKDLTRLCITSGLDGDEGKILEIAPTMKSITIDGKRYFRVDQARQWSEDGKWAALYLWDGYGKELLRRHRAKNNETKGQQT